MKPIDYLDGFSGYGGFYLGLKAAGVEFNNVYFSEIDKHAIANYSYNFPNHKHVGSIKDVSRDTIGNIDLFTFGWPCQDNSIAGKRKGQSGGTRSGLLHEAVRILNECKPRNFIAENVLGLLSVNAGIDFVQSLELLAYLNQECPQYDIEMQLLNTRWVLPQNRERLFFVGHLRGSSSRKIFPIGESTGFCNRPDEAAEEIHNIAQTMTARQFASWNGNYVSVARMCGRHLVDGKRKDVKGAPTDQRLEINEAGISNCLSTVQKDNLVVCGTLRPGLNGEGFRVGSVACAPTLTTKNDENTSGTIVVGGTNTQIRRLTPLECERLQGLPDNHTKYGIYDGVTKEISDTQRYKLCGNGVSVPIIKLIGKQLFRA